MNKEIQVNGIDTIRGLVGEPPKETEVPHSLLHNQEISRQGWNAIYIAIIPYCYVCKEPLVWHTHPQGKVLFHCPKCKRKWVKGKDWKKPHG